jgi:hypothetical protein
MSRSGFAYQDDSRGSDAVFSVEETATCEPDPHRSKIARRRDLIVEDRIQSRGPGSIRLSFEDD